MSLLRHSRTLFTFTHLNYQLRLHLLNAPPNNHLFKIETIFLKSDIVFVAVIVFKKTRRRRQFPWQQCL